jgi:hypothetical protein
MTTATVKMMDPKELRTDGGTQVRAKLDSEVIEEYRAAMAAGAKFPAVEAVHDGQDRWVWDGHQRTEAALQVPGYKLAVNVQPGTKRDAVLLACGANATHGLRRTNADKIRAVRRLLADDEWSKWSNSEIARRCAVSHTFVGILRKEREESSPATVAGEAERRSYTTKHGTKATMDISRMKKAAGKPRSLENTFPVGSIVQIREKRRAQYEYHSLPQGDMTALKVVELRESELHGGKKRMVLVQTPSGKEELLIPRAHLKPVEEQVTVPAALQRAADGVVTAVRQFASAMRHSKPISPKAASDLEDMLQPAFDEAMSAIGEKVQPETTSAGATATAEPVQAATA